MVTLDAPADTVDIADPIYWEHDAHWTYFRRLRDEAPIHFTRDNNNRLLADAKDIIAKLNGEVVLKSDNMFIPHRIEVTKKHVAGPQGVRGRNSDNTKLLEVLGWQPEISLEDGLAKTYQWIEGRVKQSLVVSDREARQRNIGGAVLCEIW